jgi:hypothetical protein
MRFKRLKIGTLMLLLSAGTALAGDPSYSVKVEVAPVKRGQRGVAKIRIRPGSGFHVNKEYPAKVAIVAPQCIAVEKPNQTVKDAVMLEESGAEEI